MTVQSQKGIGVTMKSNLRLYIKYVSIILQSTMQYKISFVLTVIGRFLIAFSGLVGIYFLFGNFTEIKGYTYGDILLCFSIIQLSFYLAEVFGRGFGGFSGMVKRGEFDRILVRPRSPILQVVGSRFELGMLGPLFSSTIMLIMGIRHNNIEWTFMKILTLILMILGGMLLFLGLFIIGATICFFSIEDPGCMNVLTYGGKEHGKYPIDVYGKSLFQFCTYIVPYTLVQYYPLQYLIGKSDRWQYTFFPLGTILFVALCYGFWRIGVSRYTSCGS